VTDIDIIDDPRHVTVTIISPIPLRMSEYMVTYRVDSNRSLDHQALDTIFRMGLVQHTDVHGEFTVDKIVTSETSCTYYCSATPDETAR
jgi:hypothetical protein